jgi:hypothetical protein
LVTKTTATTELSQQMGALELELAKERKFNASLVGEKDGLDILHREISQDLARAKVELGEERRSHGLTQEEKKLVMVKLDDERRAKTQAESEIARLDNDVRLERRYKEQEMHDKMEMKVELNIERKEKEQVIKEKQQIESALEKEVGEKNEVVKQLINERKERDEERIRDKKEVDRLMRNLEGYQSKFGEQEAAFLDLATKSSQLDRELQAKSRALTEKEITERELREKLAQAESENLDLATKAERFDRELHAMARSLTDKERTEHELLAKVDESLRAASLGAQAEFNLRRTIGDLETKLREVTKEKRDVELFQATKIEALKTQLRYLFYLQFCSVF